MFLPSLGELPSLKKLVIEELNDVKVVGSEFIRTRIPFSKLENLEIRNMRGWEVWSTKSGVVGAVMFTCLKELYIKDCPNLAEFSLEALPSLKVLDLRGLSDEVWKGVMNYLGSVELLSIWMCNEIRYLRESKAEASKKKGTSSSHSKLVYAKLLSEKEMLLDTSMPPMLEFVRIKRWKNLQSINELTCFIYITYLTILDCSNIESFPAADLPKLTSLTDLTILNCKSMDIDSFGVWPPKLRTLMIGNLKTLILKLGPQNFPPSLVELFLYGGSREEEDVTCGSQLSHMLPSSLTKLWLKNFEQLET
ncbi:NB-ARC domains-containing protein, partial [Tanacetum coccineum]